jgi:hypothetical protein
MDMRFYVTKKRHSEEKITYTAKLYSVDVNHISFTNMWREDCTSIYYV